jgi:oligopeptide transport system permease protein
MMRAVDVLYAMPSLVVIILIMVYFRAGQPEQFTGIKAMLYRWDNALGGLLFIFVGIGITSWLQMARVARGETLAMKQRDFVESAVALGIGNSGLILRHILPNILGPCIVMETATIPGYILTEAFLSFIGLGVNPPTPSWGSMINEGYQAMRSYPHVILWPVVILTATVLAFNFAGDGLRDALDPRLSDG